jgi:hypothetical protein
MPCPLCLAGLTEPHSREDWKRIGPGGDLNNHLEKVLADRREETYKRFEAKGISRAEVDGMFICG